MIKLNQNYPFVKVKSNSRQEMYSRRSHSHKEVSLGYIETGSTTIKVQNQKYRLISGDIVLIPSETVHLCTPDNDGNYKFVMLYFDSLWWNSHFNISSDSFKTLAIPSSESLRFLILQIAEGGLDVRIIEQNIVVAVKELMMKFELKNRKEDRSEQMIEILHGQLKEMPQISISVEEMAEQAGLNKFSFIRKYAQRYGLTPHADVVNMRIQRAILLFETDMDLLTIAMECGFADQSHFINQFKLYTGFRPQEYRLSLSRKE